MGLWGASLAGMSMLHNVTYYVNFMGKKIIPELNKFPYLLFIEKMLLELDETR